MIEDGNAIHYSAVERGTPVYGSDEVEVGKVDVIVDNYRERILDGIVIETPERKLLFVDAPEVARTAERAVTLNITAAECADLPPPEKQGPAVSGSGGGGVLKRLFGRGR
jgi:hypothetical protein